MLKWNLSLPTECRVYKKITVGAYFFQIFGKISYFRNNMNPLLWTSCPPPQDGASLLKGDMPTPFIRLPHIRKLFLLQVFTIYNPVECRLILNYFYWCLCSLLEIEDITSVELQNPKKWNLWKHFNKLIQNK